jgi:hypothetical protein
MSELQLEQRRQAAAKPHPDGCACMQCFYRARKVAREGGEQTFPTRVDWKAAMDLERAARARLGEMQDAVDQEDQAVDDLVSGKVNRAGASSTNTVSQDKEVQFQGDQAPDIVTFTTSPDYLGLELSPPQRALLKASYGIKLEPDELECFQTCTGRQLDPQINFGTVVVIVGARGGKDSRFVGPSALYESTFGGHKVAKGEDAVIALYAQDRDAANVTFQYISDYVSESPVLSKRLVGMPLRRSLKLEGGFTIRTFPASRTAGRAYSFPLVCLNESAFFRFEGSANADVEILTSVRRGMLNFPRRKLLIVSTPYAKAGILFDHFTKFYGRDDSRDVLVWKAPSAYMNPSISVERLEEERRTMDPSHFAREFLAEFIDAASAWLPAELIEQAVDVGIVERPCKSGVSYTMAIDASGAGNCAFAVTIGHLETQGDVTVVVQDVARTFMKPQSGKLNLKAVMREILSLAAAYNHIEFAFSDSYAGQWPVQSFEETALELGMKFTLKDPVIMRGPDLIRLTKSDAFLETAPLFRTGRIQLVNMPAQVRELRNLEARATEGGRVKVGKPMVRGELDDMATAMATMAAMLATKRKPGGFVQGVAIMNKDYTQASRGRVRADGYIEGSGGHFVSKSGERYFDPRYS